MENKDKKDKKEKNNKRLTINVMHTQVYDDLVTKLSIDLKVLVFQLMLLDKKSVRNDYIQDTFIIKEEERLKNIINKNFYRRMRTFYDP